MSELARRRHHEVDLVGIRRTRTALRDFAANSSDVGIAFPSPMVPDDRVVGRSPAPARSTNGRPFVRVDAPLAFSRKRCRVTGLTSERGES